MKDAKKTWSIKRGVSVKEILDQIQIQEIGPQEIIWFQWKLHRKRKNRPSSHRHMAIGIGFVHLNFFLSLLHKVFYQYQIRIHLKQVIKALKLFLVVTLIKLAKRRSLRFCLKERGFKDSIGYFHHLMTWKKIFK